MTEDIRDLAAFGYKQVLDRTLGSFSSFAASFSYISVLTGVFQTFYLGYGPGGPAAFWTWPMVFVGQLTVALCFAELAASYPLSGGIYQWSRSISSRPTGWMAGWIYLCGSVISLAAVALALEATLPQIAPGFQSIGDSVFGPGTGRNAVVLGCVLIALTTLINSVGVRWMARINNVGVVVELAGVALLIVLLAANIRRGPAILLHSQYRGDGSGLGSFLAAALMSSYVLYGFDTAGTLAEETGAPRRRAPRAILQALMTAAIAGGLLILFGILAVSDPSRPEMGMITGGLPFVVKDVLGSRLGGLLLVTVILAVVVCALAVHAAAARLVFAMARDNNLPFAQVLSHVSPRTRAPAAAILIVNVNLPNVIEVLSSIAIVWANLAYLMVTGPLLIARLRRRNDLSTRLGGSGVHVRPGAGRDPATRPYFSLGRWGLLINMLAVAWGVLLVINIGWPRLEVYGSSAWGRYAAPLATLTLVLSGSFYYQWFQQKKSGILAKHVAEEILDPGTIKSKNSSIETYWIGQLAAGE
jgi:urea carboxylase system permease